MSNSKNGRGFEPQQPRSARFSREKIRDLRLAAARACGCPVGPSRIKKFAIFCLDLRILENGFVGAALFLPSLEIDL